jgi:hypothetical protein
MSPLLLGAVAVAYLWVGYGYIRAGRVGMAVAFVAYAFANLGFILDLRK